MNAAFTTAETDEALEQYCGENETLHGQLNAEFDKFKAKSGDYGRKWKTTEILMRIKVAKILEGLDAATMGSSTNRLVAVLSAMKTEELSSRTMFEGMKNDTSTSHEQRLFSKMGAEILSIVSHA